MSKKVLVISTSLREGGNSDTLVEEFIKGAKSAGHEVSKISLAGKTIGFCRGCLSCQSTEKCVIEDDASLISDEVEKAEVVVFATPIYYYEMSGQMKTLLDRCNPLYARDYKFREVYMLAAAAEDGEEVSERAVSGLGGWVECFPKAKLAGHLLAGGVTEVAEIKGHPALKEAYEMGANI